MVAWGWRFGVGRDGLVGWGGVGRGGGVGVELVGRVIWGLLLII